MASFGSVLEKARNRKRISLDDVARETRLAKRYLRALEGEALNKLPGGAYNRAYLRTYATFLGLDPDKLLGKYEEEEASQTEAGQLSVRPDALETIRQAAARKQPAPGLASRAFASVFEAPARIAAVAAVVILLGALAWVGSARFTRAPARQLASDDRADDVTATPVGDWSRRVPADLPTEASAGNLQPDSPAPRPPVVQSALAPEARQRTVAASVDASEGVVVPSQPQAAQSAIEAEVSDATALAEARGDVGLAVPQSGVGTDVVDRQLVGQSETFTVGTRVVFWTRIVGGGSGDSVSHVWLHNGQTTGVVDLPIGGPSWRTQSRRTLAPDAEGTWVVEARDSEGRVLARHEFRCES